jgi:hypothetical protein
MLEGMSEEFSLEDTERTREANVRMGARLVKKGYVVQVDDAPGVTRYRLTPEGLYFVSLIRGMIVEDVAQKGKIEWNDVVVLAQILHNAKPCT